MHKPSTSLLNDPARAWAPFEPSSARPWDLASVAHLHRRAGFAASRDMARQLVRHGHLTVNARKVDIPSYRVREHDIIQVREKSRELIRARLTLP